MTIVNRRTFVAGRGHMDEVIDMLKAQRDNAENDRIVRIYRPHYAPFDVVVMEFEFDSVAEMEMAWEEWFASEEAATFMKRWVEITESGGENQVWILE